jgi:hypothetical protein
VRPYRSLASILPAHRVPVHASGRLLTKWVGDRLVLTHLGRVVRTLRLDDTRAEAPHDRGVEDNEVDMDAEPREAAIEVWMVAIVQLR